MDGGTPSVLVLGTGSLQAAVQCGRGLLGQKLSSKIHLRFRTANACAETLDNVPTSLERLDHRCQEIDDERWSHV